MKKSELNIIAAIILASPSACAIDVDYSVLSVPEEHGISLTCMTKPNDYVAMPSVQRKRGSISWLTNRVISLSPDGENLAFVSLRDGKTNIFIKNLNQITGAVQRTNRNKILDFNYSPDGKKICFSEDRGNGYQVFITDARSGFVCQQYTSGGNDHTPVYSPDMTKIYFTRSESQGFSIWSCDIDNGMLSSYTTGFNPNPARMSDGTEIILCTRMNGDGLGEIWMLDAVGGTEKCLVSDLQHSFTTPQLSPDGRWIVCTGSTAIPIGNSDNVYLNTDIYIAKSDGSTIRQLTFHAADDISPTWSPDGQYIYFISQRGNADGKANIWRIPFNEINYM